MRDAPGRVLERALALPRPLWWAATLALAGLIFWLSSSPDAQGATGWIDLSPPRDKIVHALVFGTLAVLLYGATRRPLVAVAVASLYGAVDELHQATVPGRQADVLDWLADTTGAALAVALVVFLTRRRSSRARRLQ